MWLIDVECSVANKQPGFELIFLVSSSEWKSDFGSVEKSGTGYIKQNRTKRSHFLFFLPKFLSSTMSFSIFIPYFLFVSSLFKATSLILRLLPSLLPFLPLVLHYLLPNLFLFTLTKEATSFSKTFLSVFQTTRCHVQAVYNVCIRFFLLDRKAPAQRSTRRLASVASYAACRGRLAADEGR